MTLTWKLWQLDCEEVGVVELPMAEEEWVAVGEDYYFDFAEFVAYDVHSHYFVEVAGIVARAAAAAEAEADSFQEELEQCPDCMPSEAAPASFAVAVAAVGEKEAVAVKLSLHLPVLPEALPNRWPRLHLPELPAEVVAGRHHRGLG